MKLELIRATDTIALRHQVLRAHQPRSACVYPGDEDEQSFHVGACVDGDIRCVASFFRQETPHSSLTPMYRLRGMATALEFRGQGLGAAVLDFGCRHARAQGGAVVWCNARVSALGFYAGKGFEKASDCFEIEGIGEHFVLVKAL